MRQQQDDHVGDLMTRMRSLYVDMPTVVRGETPVLLPKKLTLFHGTVVDFRPEDFEVWQFFSTNVNPPIGLIGEKSSGRRERFGSPRMYEFETKSEMWFLTSRGKPLNTPAQNDDEIVHASLSTGKDIAGIINPFDDPRSRMSGEEELRVRGHPLESLTLVRTLNFPDWWVMRMTAYIERGKLEAALSSTAFPKPALTEAVSRAAASASALGIMLSARTREDRVLSYSLLRQFSGSEGAMCAVYGLVRHGCEPGNHAILAYDDGPPGYDPIEGCVILDALSEPPSEIVRKRALAIAMWSYRVTRGMEYHSKTLEPKIAANIEQPAESRSREWGKTRIPLCELVHPVIYGIGARPASEADPPQLAQKCDAALRIVAQCMLRSIEASLGAPGVVDAVVPSAWAPLVQRFMPTHRVGPPKPLGLIAPDMMQSLTVLRPPELAGLRALVEAAARAPRAADDTDLNYAIALLTAVAGRAPPTARPALRAAAAGQARDLVRRLAPSLPGMVESLAAEAAAVMDDRGPLLEAPGAASRERAWILAEAARAADVPLWLHEVDPDTYPLGGLLYAVRQQAVAAVARARGHMSDRIARLLGFSVGNDADLRAMAEAGPVPDVPKRSDLLAHVREGDSSGETWIYDALREKYRTASYDQEMFSLWIEWHSGVEPFFGVPLRPARSLERFVMCTRWGAPAHDEAFCKAMDEEFDIASRALADHVAKTGICISALLSAMSHSCYFAKRLADLALASQAGGALFVDVIKHQLAYSADPVPVIGLVADALRRRGAGDCGADLGAVVFYDVNTVADLLILSDKIGDDERQRLLLALLRCWPGMEVRHRLPARRGPLAGLTGDVRAEAEFQTRLGAMRKRYGRHAWVRVEDAERRYGLSAETIWAHDSYLTSRYMGRYDPNEVAALALTLNGRTPES